MSKAEHVRRESRRGNARLHNCAWPGCTRQVPLAMWGCRPHWYRLPREIRDAIWKAYQPGQEKTLNVSRAYVEAARRAVEWIRKNHPEECDEQEAKADDSRAEL